jgi:hypothetical protein
MSAKTIIFVILAAAIAVLGLLASRHDPKFAENAWSELFWLIAGALATTILLDSILERSAAARRRREDQFAFRTFTATVLASLLELMGAETQAINELMACALIGNEKFASASRKARDIIATVPDIRPPLYNPMYLDIASHLRALSERYIRIYSSTHEEMLEHYQRLQALARRWNYRDALAESAMAHTESMRQDDPVKKTREAEIARHLHDVRQAVDDTAAYLSKVAERVAAGAGMPAA